MSAANVEADVVDRLAALIREVDGRHLLGAGALAEALVERGVTLPAPALTKRSAHALTRDDESLPERMRGWHCTGTGCGWKVGSYSERLAGQFFADEHASADLPQPKGPSAVRVAIGPDSTGYVIASNSLIVHRYSCPTLQNVRGDLWVMPWEPPSDSAHERACRRCLKGVLPSARVAS